MEKNKPEQYHKLFRATKFAVFTPLILSILGTIGWMLAGNNPTPDNLNLFVYFLIVIGGTGARLTGLVALGVVLVSIKSASYNLLYLLWWVLLLLSSLFFMFGSFAMLQ